MTEMRNSKGQFVVGNPGGGRPIGAKARLSEAVLEALGRDFRDNGAAIIAKVRQEHPTAYLKICASLCPRQLTIERLSPLADLSDDELALIERTLRAGRAKPVVDIEPHKGDAVAPLIPMDVEKP